MNLPNPVGLILRVLAVTLVFAAMAQPYWSYSLISGSGSLTSQTTYFGDHRLREIYLGSTTTTSEVSYYSDPLFSDTSMAAVFVEFRLLLFVVAAFVLLTLALSFLPAQHQLDTVRFLLDVMAMVVALLAPLYLLWALPPAVATDLGHNITEFWGSSPVLGGAGTSSWGPSTGWALALATPILTFLALLVASRTRSVATIRVRGP